MKPILKSKAKKSIINQTISIFILVLMVVIIAGFVYWFVSEFKETIATTDEQTGYALNETCFFNQTGYTFSHANDLGFAHPVITAAYNATDGTAIALTDITQTGNVLTNTSTAWDNATMYYDYGYTGGTAYHAINDTEAASLNIIDLLPFIFMALGFVIIIGVLIRILVPIMNLGQSFGSSGF